MSWWNNMTYGDIAKVGGPTLAAPVGVAGYQTLKDVNQINKWAAQGYGAGNKVPQHMLKNLTGAYVPNKTFEKLGYGKGSLKGWWNNTVSPTHFKPAQTVINPALRGIGTALNTAKNFGLGALRYGLTNPYTATAAMILGSTPANASEANMTSEDFAKEFAKEAEENNIKMGSRTGDETLDPYTGRNMRDIAGEVGEYGNIGDIRLNEMERIIADKEFEEQPGIHFKDKPIENIFNRQNDPTKGFIDRNFRYRDLNKPEGINYDKRGFGLLGILQGLKNQFKINPEKQKEFDSWEENKNQKGWGYIGDTGLRGNIYEGPGGKKFSLVDPTTGYNVLQNKNWRGGTGNSLREQINLKNAWIADRLLRGKGLSRKARAYAKLNKLGTYADQETFTPPPGGGPLNEPGGEWVGGAPAYTHQGIGGGEYTNEIGNVEYQDPYDPGGGEAAGGLMRTHSRGRYSKGGRVGILAAF